MNCSNWETETKLPLVTSCKQAARLFSLSLERKLTIREYIVMRVHLFMCKTCTFYGNQVKALRAIFIRHEEVLSNTPVSSDDQLSDKAKMKIKKSLMSNDDLS
ncbi:MAG: zf-HC2 domain-containing protein [Candidatus Omnitrophica bacterium]|nr:zf-HC2 domain-containing protein [Candidatus Omnitrophota bacterium]